VSQPRVRILLVDDHRVLREGLERILGFCEDFEVVGSAADGKQALEEARRLKPDLVLLDLALPGMHGLEVIPRLLERESHPRILVLTVHDDDEMATKAVRAGAHGYILKSTSSQELTTAIRRVAAGGQYYDPVVVRGLMREGQADPQEQLTEKEAIVLRLVAAGLTNREIAAQLYVSIDTVKSHLESVFRKLGVSDRTHAVAVALRRHLLD
jgi:DNA-binding NarL/FixJ family response regulator